MSLCKKEGECQCENVRYMFRTGRIYLVQMRARRTAIARERDSGYVSDKVRSSVEKARLSAM